MKISYSQKVLLALVLSINLFFSASAVVSHPAGQIIMPGGGSLADLVPSGQRICTDVNGLCAGSKWNNVSGGINYAGGNVGIGTATPDSKLHVQSDNSIEIAKFQGYVSDTNSDIITSVVRLAHDNNDAYGGFIKLFRQAQGASHDMRIGTRITGADSDFITLREGGNVGIGKNAPSEKLDVDGNIRASGIICDINGCIGSGGVQTLGTSGNSITLSGGGGSVVAPYANTAATASYATGAGEATNSYACSKDGTCEVQSLFASGNAEVEGDLTLDGGSKLKLGNGGNTYISGTMTMDNIIFLEGDVRIGNIQPTTSGTDICVINAGTFYEIRSGCSSSSIKYKKDIKELNAGIGVVEKLHPVTFTWKEDGKKDIGFIAEEVEKINPVLVTYDEKGEIEGVKYKQLTAVLTKAIQEQQTQIEELQTELCRKDSSYKFCKN